MLPPTNGRRGAVLPKFNHNIRTMAVITVAGLGSLGVGIPAPIKAEVKKSPEQRAKDVVESIPLEKRAVMVYVPVVLMKMVLSMAQQISDTLRDLKYSETRKVCRDIRSVCERYHNEELRGMGAELFASIRNKANAFHDNLWRDNYIYRVQIDRVVAKEIGHSIPIENFNVVTSIYLARIILEYIVKYDRESASYLSKVAGTKVRFEVSENHYHTQLRELLNELLSIFELPRKIDLSDKQLDLSYKVFLNKVRSLEDEVKNGTLNANV